MKKFCVFMGARGGNNAVYAQAARDLAEALLKEKIGLVYGGSAAGLMGELANTMLAGGGSVEGVITKEIAAFEKPHPGLESLIYADNLQLRKRKMNELSDGFVVLPGGLGTLDELFDIWTEIKIGEHNKPLGVLNVNGYFDKLWDFMDHVIAEGFMPVESKRLIKISDNAVDLLQSLNH